MTSPRPGDTVLLEDGRVAIVNEVREDGGVGVTVLLPTSSVAPRLRERRPTVAAEVHESELQILGDEPKKAAKKVAKKTARKKR